MAIREVSGLSFHFFLIFDYVCAVLVSTWRRGAYPRRRWSHARLQKVSALACPDEVSTRTGPGAWVQSSSRRPTDRKTIRASLRPAKTSDSEQVSVSAVGCPDMSSVDRYSGTLSGPCQPSGS